MNAINSAFTRNSFERFREYPCKGGKEGECCSLQRWEVRPPEIALRTQIPLATAHALKPPHPLLDGGVGHEQA